MYSKNYFQTHGKVEFYYQHSKLFFEVELNPKFTDTWIAIITDRSGSIVAHITAFGKDGLRYFWYTPLSKKVIGIIPYSQMKTEAEEMEERTQLKQKNTQTT